jgi:hypothetical protein
MTLEEAVAWAEREGFYWALERNQSGYSAVVNRKPDYAGDDLALPGVQDDNTPAKALAKAIKKELAHEAAQRS